MLNSVSRCRLGALLLLGCLCLSLTAQGGGTWTALNNAPPSGLDAGLLLSDGTVICCNGGSNWYRLTPDLHGSYVNGSWSQIASMNYSRLFFSSDVLTNGNVYVAGGEYGGGPAELYSALSNTWTVISPPSENFSDACSMVLPDGNVLQSDSQSSYVIYNAAANLMTAGGSCEDMNETCWVRMPNDNILAVTGYSQTSEHYVPSLNAWYADNNVPVPVYGYGGELGAALVLPNGNVFQIGATNNTAIYTPGSTLTSAGSWVAGPQMVFGTNQLGGVDAPASMMITGNVLLCIGPVAGFDGPCSFYEYNWLSNTFTPENAPGGGTTYGGAPFGTSMLNLPDGTVLFVSGQGTTSLFVYAPSGAPLAAGQPSISSITENGDGSYQLTGVGLNGISGGSAYGDDWQMNTSYPLVRLTNSSSGNVYYARTYNWSSTTIQSTNPVTTEFSLPAGLPAGTYSLVVTVMGNVSAATNFVYAPPAVPTGLTGTGGNAHVVLSWNAVPGATTYDVKCLTTTPSYFFATVATVTGTSCTNVGLINGMSYFYAVAAVGAGGESANSPAIFVTPAGPPPTPVGATAVPDTFARIDLAWTASYGATNYIISRSTTLNGPYSEVAASVVPFYSDASLVTGTTYYYEIAAMSAGGESSNSIAVNATASTVGNFGFETPSIGSGNYQYDTSNAFWAFSGASPNGSGILANGSAFSNPNAPQGVQAAFVEEYGTIAQSISGFVPGTSYTVTYQAAQRSGASQNGGESWNVMVDGTVIQTNSPGGTAYADYAATFVATATKHTLSFVGTDLAGGDNTVFLDNVQAGVSLSGVANGGFELPGIGSGNYRYDPTGGSWIFDGASPNGSGIVANGSAFGNPNAPQGVQAAFVQEYGRVSQTITGFVPGTTYAINYVAAQRPGNVGESWNVEINNAVIQSNSPGGTTYAAYTATFVATATTLTLAFVGTDLAGGDNTVFIDDVRILSLLQPVAPTVTLTAPASGSIFSVPVTISLAANVTANGSLISNVQFYADGTNLIGQVNNPPYNCGWTNPVNGNHDIFAKLTCTGGSVVDSPASVVTVVNSNVNFGFELPGIGSGNYQYNPSGGSWVFGGAPGGGSGIVANGSGFGNPNAPQGAQASFVQSYGSMAQTLTNFVPGASYVITFSAAQRGGTSQHGGESWSVMIDGIVITNYNPGGTSYATYTTSFTAWAPFHTLSFAGTDFATGDNTVFIDNVSISPEPPSILLANPANNAVFGFGNPIILAATVITNGNILDSVQFYANGSLLAQVTAPFSWTWSNAPVGVSTLFAQLTYNGSKAVDSSVISLTVTNPPPALGGISLDAFGNVYIQGTGLPGSTYYLYTASNLTPPVSWTPLLTNLSDSSGNILFTNLPPTNTQQFYLLSAP